MSPRSPAASVELAAGRCRRPIPPAVALPLLNVAEMLGGGARQIRRPCMSWSTAAMAAVRPGGRRDRRHRRRDRRRPTPAAILHPRLGGRRRPGDRFLRCGGHRRQCRIVLPGRFGRDWAPRWQRMPAGGSPRRWGHDRLYRCRPPPVRHLRCGRPLPRYRCSGRPGGLARTTDYAPSPWRPMSWPGSSIFAANCCRWTCGSILELPPRELDSPLSAWWCARNMEQSASASTRLTM